MSTITREFTKEQLQQIIETDHVQCGEASALARIALASLEAEAVYFVEIEDGQDINAGRIEGKNRPDLSLLPDGINHLYAAPPAPANAEPLAWLWSHRKHPSEVTLVRPEDDEKAEGAHWSGWSCQALYAEPPAPVSVPDDEQCKPHPVMAVKGELGFLDHFERIIDERDYDIEIGRLSSSNYEALMLAALDAFRAAMLQGADGNSPVIQDGWKLVPKEPTAEMQSAAASAIRFDTTPINKLWTGNAVYKAMLAAAPQQEAKP
ncbi:hypothetical protein ABKV35_00060 [Enterobacter kobei]|uniref:hypothetical protein n=1 Tax=Enterobacter kobei TaxID=208224 RepID=UPI0032AEF696